jgi:PAP2 superfamily
VQRYGEAQRAARDARTLRAGRGGLLRAVRRTHSLTAEMAILALAVLVWQLARIPFETSIPDAISASRDWMAAERAIGVAVEPDVFRWVAARPGLLDAANWFYSHMDETLVFGGFAALRLIDPLRFPTVRTAFVLTHLPAMAVVAGFPSAPPRWIPGFPGGAPPTADIGADLRNSTAAAVSLHVGIPVLVAAAAIWMRPRAPLAWATALYPALVLAVVVGTANHFLLDAVVGIACVAIGAAGALAVHGRVARGRSEAVPAGIAAAAVVWAGLAFAVNALVISLGGRS